MLRKTKENKMKKYFLAIILSGALLQSAYADDHHDAGVDIVPTQVSDNVYMLEGKGGNIGVLRGEKLTILIDSQYAEMSANLAKAVGDISDKPIAFLVNTHFHFDHTDGNESLGNSGAYIIAHENVRAKLKGGAYIAAFDKKMDAAAAAALPVMTYADGIKMYEGDEEVELLHFQNAHTDGDTTIFFKTSNVIHTGDIYFHGIYPFIDMSNGGSIEGVIAAMGAIIERADGATKIIPGHGKLSDRTEMQKDHAMLTEFSAVVKKAVGEGKGNEAIAKLEAAQKYDSVYGGGFLSIDKFVEIIADSYR
jgi:cyclase